MLKRKVFPGIFIISFLLFMLSFNWSVLQKERLLSGSGDMVLALAPVDPRSLMQGDYMILEFAVCDEIEGLLREKRSARHPGSFGQEPREPGVVVVRPVNEVRATRIRGPQVVDIPNLYGAPELYAGQELRAGERLLRYQYRKGLTVGGGSFFFQEGTGDVYALARYALLKVSSSGEAIIVDLLDKTGRKLTPLATEGEADEDRESGNFGE